MTMMADELRVHAIADTLKSGFLRTRAQNSIVPRDVVYES